MSEALAKLRDLIGAPQTYSPRESIICSQVSCGIPKSAVTAISGAGKTEFVVQILAENPSLNVAWVEEDFLLYPCGFLQRDVSLKKVLFVDAGKEALWATLQAARSQLFEVIVLSAKAVEEKSARRLQLAAEKSGVSVVLLLEKVGRIWPAHLQLRTEKQGLKSSPRAYVVRQKL